MWTWCYSYGRGGLLSHPVPAIESLLNNVGCLFARQWAKVKVLTLALGDKTFVPGIDLAGGLGLISPEVLLAAKTLHLFLGGLRASGQLSPHPCGLALWCFSLCQAQGFQGPQEGSSPCPAWMTPGDEVI